MFNKIKQQTCLTTNNTKSIIFSALIMSCLLMTNAEEVSPSTYNEKCFGCIHNGFRFCHSDNRCRPLESNDQCGSEFLTIETGCPSRYSCDPLGF